MTFSINHYMTPINNNDIGQAPRYFGSLWSGTQFFRMSHTDVLRKIASLHVLSMFWKLWTPRMVLSKFWDTPTFQMTIEKQFTPSKCHTLTSHTDKFTVCLKSIVFNFNLFFSFWLWTTQHYTLPCTRNQVLVSKSRGYPILMSQTDKKILNWQCVTFWLPLKQVSKLILIDCTPLIKFYGHTLII